MKNQNTNGRRKVYWMLVAVCAVSLLLMGGYTIGKAPTIKGEEAEGESMIAEAKAEEASIAAPMPETEQPEATIAEAAENKEPVAPTLEAVQPDPVIMEAAVEEIGPAAEPTEEPAEAVPIFAKAKAEEMEGPLATADAREMVTSWAEPTAAASALEQWPTQEMANLEMVTESKPLVIEEAEKATATPEVLEATPTPGPVEGMATATSGLANDAEKTPEPVATATPGIPTSATVEGALVAVPAPVPMEIPTVEIKYYYDALKPGKTIRMLAVPSSMPEGYEVHYQWKNDASGELEPVPGATEAYYTFELNEENAKWGWVVEMILIPAT